MAADAGTNEQVRGMWAVRPGVTRRSAEGKGRTVLGWGPAARRRGPARREGRRVSPPVSPANVPANVPAREAGRPLGRFWSVPARGTTNRAHGEGMSACDGCLGRGECWVCLGTGVLQGGDGFRPCHRCYGSGRCWLCQQIVLADIEDPPLFSLGSWSIGRRRRPGSDSGQDPQRRRA